MTQYQPSLRKNPQKQEYKFLYHNVIFLKREKKKSNRKYFGSKINRDQKTPLGIIETGQSHNIIKVKDYNNKLQLYNGFSLVPKYI